MPKSNGFHKRSCDIRRALWDKKPYARLPVPNRLHKRTYERKYDNMVRNNDCFHGKEQRLPDVKYN